MWPEESPPASLVLNLYSSSRSSERTIPRINVWKALSKVPGSHQVLTSGILTAISRTEWGQTRHRRSPTTALTPTPPSQPATQADCHPWNDTPTSFLPESWGGRGAKASLACMCPGGEVGIAWAAATWAPALSLLLLFPPPSHSHLC